MSKIQNPIIPGFYPDPSICRVGDDYYIACSSFELYPGIPIFHSRDLIHWTEVGHAVGPENAFHMEANCGVGGMMAPTLRYHDGTFYILCCNFADRGNFMVTAKDPAGPWSEIHWLDDIPGIDASFFFDNDGQCYVMGTGNVWDNGAGVMERGIWLAKYDIEHFKMDGEPFTIWNCALRVASSPEAPHLYHIGDYYYLMIAEGGTEHFHSVAVARSKELFSFFEGYAGNPVLTHRHMGWHAPIINVGHADFVELPDGSWYAVFLGSRLIEGECKNLGRETFICPVIWERGWPIFSPETGKVEWEYDAPKCLPEETAVPEPTRDEFDSDELPLYWTFWGTPYEKYYEIKDSKLSLRCIPQSADDEVKAMSFEPSHDKNAFVAYVARRQRQPKAQVTTKMSFMPKGKETAGLILVQAMNFQLHIVRCEENGKQLLRVISVTSDFITPPYFPGFSSHTEKNTVAEVSYDAEDVVLRLSMDGEDWKISYGSSEDDLKELCDFDGHIINPEKVGCMIGTMLGMYASGNGTESSNRAEFDFFELI